MKYVMFKAEFAGMERLVPIIFPDTLVHAMMADHMKALIKESFSVKGTISVVSAGDIDIVGVRTHGKSETLKCAAKQSDARVISEYDYMHGIVHGRTAL